MNDLIEQIKLLQVKLSDNKEKFNDKLASISLKQNKTIENLFLHNRNLFMTKVKIQNIEQFSLSELIKLNKSFESYCILSFTDKEEILKCNKKYNESIKVNTEFINKELNNIASFINSLN